MSNLTARLLTAAVAIPILVAAIRWINPIAVWLLIFGATIIGLREFYNMTLAKQPVSERAFGVVVGAVCGAALYWFDDDALVVPSVFAFATIASFLFYLFRYREMETVAGRVAQMIAGIAYVALLLTYVALLKKRGPVDGGAWVFIVLTCTWFSDTGAYFAGRFIGPHWPRKLYESVSPKKTVIGGLGGLGGSFLALVVAKLWYLPALTWADCALIAIPANVLGQMGDLCESMLKRSVGVKDSGALLPGHGGMLDRIDALLFSAPYIYVFARFCFGKI